MKTFHHSFTVDASIDKVWDFYTDLHHLEIITPKRLDFKIIESSSNKITLEQTAYFSSKLLTRMTWKTKITTCKPYTYVDEMNNALFKRWRHTHVFHKINENQTKVTDAVEFELQYGFVGKMFERYALDKLKKIFTHRQQAIIEFLSKLWILLDGAKSLSLTISPYRLCWDMDNLTLFDFF